MVMRCGWHRLDVAMSALWLRSLAPQLPSRLRRLLPLLILLQSHRLLVPMRQRQLLLLILFRLFLQMIL